MRWLPDALGLSLAIIVTRARQRWGSRARQLGAFGRSAWQLGDVDGKADLDVWRAGADSGGGAHHHGATRVGRGELHGAE